MMVGNHLPSANQLIAVLEEIRKQSVFRVPAFTLKYDRTWRRTVIRPLNNHSGNTVWVTFLGVGMGRDSKSKQRVSCLKECFRRESIWVFKLLSATSAQSKDS